MVRCFGCGVGGCGFFVLIVFVRFACDLCCDDVWLVFVSFCVFVWAVFYNVFVCRCVKSCMVLCGLRLCVGCDCVFHVCCV